MTIRWAVAVAICLAMAIAPARSAQNQNVHDPYSQSLNRVRLLSNSPYVRLLPMGKSVEGRSIPALVITDFRTGIAGKARVFVCAGQHGNETAPIKSMLSLCARLASGRNSALLAKCVIIVVPIANPDGLARQQRYNAQGIDLNRDWWNLTSPETRYIDKIIRGWSPHALLDVHEWLEHSPRAKNTIEVPYCAPKARETATMRLARYTGHNSQLSLIRTGSNHNLFHSRYASAGFAAYLFETAPNRTYQQKNTTYIAAAMTIIDQVSQHNALEQLSPASDMFQMASVAKFIALPDVGKPVVSDTFMWGLVIAVGSCLVLVMLMPTPRKKSEKWSRHYKKCSLEEYIPADCTHNKSQLIPLTARSWVHRRTRSRYA